MARHHTSHDSQSRCHVSRLSSGNARKRQPYVTANKTDSLSESALNRLPSFLLSINQYQLRRPRVCALLPPASLGYFSPAPNGIWSYIGTPKSSEAARTRRIRTHIVCVTHWQVTPSYPSYPSMFFFSGPPMHQQQQRDPCQRHASLTLHCS